MIESIQNSFIQKYHVWGNEFDFHADNRQAILWYANGKELTKFRGWRNLQDYLRVKKLTPLEYCESVKKVLENTRIHRGFTQPSQKYVVPWWVVVDCWANQGWSTMVYANQVGSAGKVIAIEWDLWNSNQIQKNIDLNGYENVQNIHAACSDESGNRISFDGEHVGMWDNSSIVRTVCLDDYSSYKPTFIKIDVEGYELKVLQWATNILGKVKPYVEIELHSTKILWKYWTTRKQVVELMKNHGYSVLPWRGRFYHEDDLYWLLKDKEVWLFCEPYGWEKDKTTPPSVENARLENRLELLHSLPKWGVMAEIGVWRGLFSRQILDICKPKLFYLIDPWLWYGQWHTSTKENSELWIAHPDEIFSFVQESFHGDERIQIKRMKSLEAVKNFDDNYFDAVYIDWDHRYTSAHNDIQAWFPKVKEWWVLCWDDMKYLNIPSSLNEQETEQNWVPRAVIEFFTDTTFPQDSFRLYGDNWSIYNIGGVNEWE